MPGTAADRRRRRRINADASDLLVEFAETTGIPDLTLMDGVRSPTTIR
jgi:glyoxylate carboligase